MQRELAVLSLFGLLIVPVCGLSQSGETVFSSGEQRTTLVELYTSEGCSSCPPADRWLSGLRNDPGLWTGLVPIALHVDYWDYIGWKDRFAQASFSERQRRYAAQGNARIVYTPGLFQNGQEWRGWRDGKKPQYGQTRVGVLSLAINATEVTISFEPDDKFDTDLVAHVAVLGMNQRTKVLDGENHGKTLRHDFVALHVAQTAMTRGSGRYTANKQLPKSVLKSSDRALIAWVSEKNRQTPIQSVGGYLDDR